MIIFGSRIYFKENTSSSFGTCDQCGFYGKLWHYEGRKFGHIYFIPILPEGPRMRIMNECPKCKMGAHTPLKNIDAVYKNIESMMHPCIEAASNNKRTFKDLSNGQEMPNDAFLQYAIETLMQLGRSSEIPELIELLNNEPAQYEYLIASALLDECNGKPNSSLKAYNAAIELEPEREFSYLTAAAIYGRKGKHEENYKYLKSASELLPENWQLLLSMITPLEQMQQYDEINELIAKAIELEPQLEKDKKFKKTIKQFAKKGTRAVIA